MADLYVVTTNGYTLNTTNLIVLNQEGDSLIWQMETTMIRERFASAALAASWLSTYKLQLGVGAARPTTGVLLAAGVASLVAGQVMVSPTLATAASEQGVFVLSYYGGPTSGAVLRYGDIVEGVSFMIYSSNPADTNKVSWAIMAPDTAWISS